MKYQEHLDQVKFVQRVRHTRKELIMFSVPNGGKREKREAIRLKAEGMLAGVPDIMIAEPSREFHGLFLEFKTAKGKPSESQKEIITKLREKNYKCVIVRSADDAWRTLMWYLEEDYDA